MIDTVPFAIGFVVYVVFCLVTFDVYSKREDVNKIFAFLMIYAYYTLLAGYVISFVDSNASFFEVFMEITFYAVTCGLFLYSHYKSVLEKTGSGVGYGESPDNKLF